MKTPKKKLTTSIFALVKKLDNFSYELSVVDRVWNILFPVKEKQWHHLHINKYKQVFYITHVNGDGGSIEVEQKKDVQILNSTGAKSSSIENHDQLTAIWAILIESAHKWLKAVTKDWIKTNKRIQVEYPLHQRYGIAPMF